MSLFQQPDIGGEHKVLLSSPLLHPEHRQQLVLEDISPIWASRLKKEDLPTFMSANWRKWHSELQKASKCVVGEAYGYSSQYTADCDECYIICHKFLYYFTLNLRGKLESNKQDFVKHWNEEHIIVNRKEPFAVAINQSSAMNQQSNFTSFQEFTPTPTGTTDVCGFSIGAVEIDLSDFGIPSGVIQPRFA
jgi:hypothetical protein